MPETVGLSRRSTSAVDRIFFSSKLQGRCFNLGHPVCVWLRVQTNCMRALTVLYNKKAEKSNYMNNTLSLSYTNFAREKVCETKRSKSFPNIYLGKIKIKQDMKMLLSHPVNCNYTTHTEFRNNIAAPHFTIALLP